MRNAATASKNGIARKTEKPASLNHLSLGNLRRLVKPDMPARKPSASKKESERPARKDSTKKNSERPKPDRLPPNANKQDRPQPSANMLTKKPVGASKKDGPSKPDRPARKPSARRGSVRRVMKSVA